MKRFFILLSVLLLSLTAFAQPKITEGYMPFKGFKTSTA